MRQVRLELQDIIDALRAGRARGPKGPLTFDTLIVTWKSVLFFGDDAVLKVRRPVDLDGENMTGLGARRVAAARERQIGRRLSPIVYLGDTVLSVDAAGEISLALGDLAGEPVVAMRRIPEAERLDHRLLEPDFKPSAMGPLMRQLFAFHVDAPVQRKAEGVGRPLRALERWRTAMADLQAGLGALGSEGGPNPSALAGLEARATALFEAREHLFAHRVAEGRIRDIHGALQLNHVFLPPTGHKARIIDPADGPDEERFIDTAEELAGLALEVGLVREPAFVEAMIADYSEQAQDRTLDRVLTLYAALVAVKRAGRAAREAVVPGTDAAAARTRLSIYLDAAAALIAQEEARPPDPPRRRTGPS
jgi:aminoglycoside phosphotransferase family enzyme